MTVSRLNFTRRRRIPRSDVRITLSSSDDGLVRYTADLNFTDEYPSNAKVFVEAHHQFRYERFDHGTIGDLLQPEYAVLRDFTVDEHPLFKVKIVEAREVGHGRLIGLAEKLRADQSGLRTGSRISLLPVEPAELGHRPWKLLLGESPVLQVNSAVGAWREVASGHEFRWLVLPGVVRSVLGYILTDLEVREVDDLSDWPQQWLHFALGLPGVGPVPAEGTEQDEDWIEDVVEQFCRSRRLIASGRRIFAEEPAA